jgi:hypothetical protein
LEGSAGEEKEGGAEGVVAVVEVKEVTPEELSPSERHDLQNRFNEIKQELRPWLRDLVLSGPKQKLLLSSSKARYSKRYVF